MTGVSEPGGPGTDQGAAHGAARQPAPVRGAAAGAGIVL